MAHLLGAQSVRISVGSRLLLDDVTLGIGDGSRVGVLGPNGAGKSTLLAALAGAREVDGGRVTRSGDTRVAMLLQSDGFAPGDTVRTAVHGEAPEHEWASRAPVRDIHAGLLADLDLDGPVAALSGGQRRRVALAAVLTAPADVVILDEPTNHLDVEGVDWLARHLNARFAGRRAAGALIAVTHDRWFLDAVCTNVWEVVPGADPGGGRPQVAGRVETYDGGYAAYVLARAERARQAAVAAAKRENLLRKELAWLRRGAPARTSKPRFRIDAAEALIADVPPPRDTVELVAMATARLGKRVIDLEDVTAGYPGPAGAPGGGDGGRAEVLRRVTWRLAPGERVGVVGVNGAGKTTLLRLLEGSLAPARGRVVRGRTVAVAALSQSTHELDALADKRVIEAVAMVGERVAVGGRELTAAQLVERLGFTRQRAWTRVGEISGGERRRLQLLRLLMTEPNVLLLDEPTNDLDTDTLAAVEDILDSFPGTLVVVSHDRYLLERVTDHQVALLGDGALRDLPGGVDQYLRLRREAAREQGASSASTGAGGPAGSTKAAPVEAGSASTGAGGEKQLSGAERRAAQKEVAAIERRLEKVGGRIAALQERMAAHDPSDYEGLRELTEEARALRLESDSLEERWLELSDRLE